MNNLNEERIKQLTERVIDRYSLALDSKLLDGVKLATMNSLMQNFIAHTKWMCNRVNGFEVYNDGSILYVELTQEFSNRLVEEYETKYNVINKLFLSVNA